MYVVRIKPGFRSTRTGIFPARLGGDNGCAFYKEIDAFSQFDECRCRAPGICVFLGGTVSAELSKDFGWQLRDLQLVDAPARTCGDGGGTRRPAPQVVHG